MYGQHGVYVFVQLTKRDECVFSMSGEHGVYVRVQLTKHGLNTHHFLSSL